MRRQFVHPVEQTMKVTHLSSFAVPRTKNTIQQPEWEAVSITDQEYDNWILRHLFSEPSSIAGLEGNVLHFDFRYRSAS